MILIDYSDVINIKWGAVRSLLMTVDALNMSISVLDKPPYKLGLDFHGVIDAAPDAFSKITENIIRAGHEVHIITGHLINDSLVEKLNALKIHWTNLFSIAEFHKENKTKMWYTDPNNPWMDTSAWDRTKAEYCEQKGIHMHIDDSDVYGQYFKTPYLQFHILKG